MYTTHALSDCTSLRGVTLPAALTAIGDYAFRGCGALAAVPIPDSVTAIGNGAFHGVSLPPAQIAIVKAINPNATYTIRLL